MNRQEFLRQEIERYKKRIETFQMIIAEFETELGISGSVPSQPSAAIMGKKGTETGDPLSLISGMIFWNKSQTEAAKMFLEMVGYPLKTGTILEALEKGGLKIGGKTPTAKKQNFYTILHRSSDIGLAAKDTWGLTSWPGVSKKSPDESEEQNGKEKETASE